MASLGRAQLWLQVMAAWWWTGPVAASCTWRGPPLRAGPARAAEVARAQARERGADPAATPARPAAVAIAKVCCAGYLVFPCVVAVRRAPLCPAAGLCALIVMVRGNARACA